MVSQQMISKVITGFILVTVLFTVAATLYPTMATSGDNLSASGAPLGGLFAGGGAVFIIIMAALLLGVIGYFKLGKGR